MKNSFFVFFITVILISANTYAFDKPAVERYVLDNGMTFLFIPRKSPSISFEVRVKVGSVDEVRGKTGLAHMLEHMMFKGTIKIGTRDYAKEESLLDKMDDVAYRMLSATDKEIIKNLEKEMKDLNAQAAQYQVQGEYDRLYTQAGGVGLNASTSDDLTSYHVTLPSGRLEFWAAMESDRMKHPVFREFYSEKEVVLKERSQRTDSSDKGIMFEEFLLHSFDANPYRYPVIGFRSDIEGLLRKDLDDFYKAHYTPENTVIAIAGGFDQEEAKAIVKKYFSNIPKGSARNTLVDSEKRNARVLLTRKSLEEPQLLIGFIKPTLPDPDDTCMDVIQDMLTGGDSSRLVRALVTKGQIASTVDSGNGLPGARYENLFMISASPLGNHTNKEVEDAIWKELGKLKTEKAAEDEIRKSVKSAQKSILKQMESDSSAAGLLSYYEILSGDFDYIYKNIEAMDKVTPEMIMACAKKYFDRERSVAAYLGD